MTRPAGLRLHRHPAGRNEQGTFDWLASIAGETIKTPGSESNVKEIFDKCWELRKSGEDLMIFNQFDEFGNYLWHYDITGHAMEETGQAVGRPQRCVSRHGLRHRFRRHDRQRRLHETGIPRQLRHRFRSRPVPDPVWKTALAPTGLKASATSTSRGSTTPATPISSSASTTTLWSTWPAVQRAGRPGAPGEIRRPGRTWLRTWTCSVSPASPTCSPRSRSPNITN